MQRLLGSTRPDMAETRLIGLVGGLGPPATVHYYRALLGECERRGVLARIVMTHADVGRVLAAAAAGDLEGMALHLADRLAELDRAGAEITAIGAVTPHMCLPELAKLRRSPIVDPIEALNGELARAGIERVALMGTRATVEGRLFGRLRAAVLDPSPGQVARIHDLYVSIVRTGQAGGDTAEALGALARELAREPRVQAVVLAGTELALVPETAWDGVRVVDCAGLHVEAIVDAATGRMF